MREARASRERGFRTLTSRVRDRDWFPIVVLTVAALVSACSATQPKGYSGKALDRSQLSLVVGAQKDDIIDQRIELTSVDGQQEIAEWKAPRGAVQLLPGRHDIGVRRAYDAPMTAGTIGYAFEAIQDFALDSGARILRLDLEPGYAYSVHLKRDPIEYYVSRFPNSSDLHPAWNPPASAIKCVAAAERKDVLECPTAELSAPLATREAP